MNFKKIWKNKLLIIKGVWNSWFPTPTIQEIAQYREEICMGCKYYDPKGESENAVLKGNPSCGICGCNIDYLTHSMESSCSREEIGDIPLWTSEKRYK